MFPSAFIVGFFLVLTEVETRSTTKRTHLYPDHVKHFESELDRNEGFWSPSTSSIDWCEKNYLISYYVAEFWNCFSSFTMCIIGGILLYRFIRDRIELRLILLCVSFIVVGLGSAYFHGTLTHLGQMADELPMVYSMIIWWYTIFQINRFKLSSNYRTSLILFSLAYAFLWTFIHNLQKFVLIFQIHFTLMVIGGIARLIFLYRQRIYRSSNILYFIVFYIGLLVLASIFWLLDQHFCEYLNNKALFNPQLHAWWHVLCAIDCHFGIVCAQSIRYLSIKHDQLIRKRLPAENFCPDDHLRYEIYFGLPFLHQPNVKTKKR